MDFYVYRKLTTEADTAFAKIATVTDKLTWIDTTVKPKTSYDYAVSSWNGSRESTKSKVLTVLTKDIPVATIVITISKPTLEVGQTATITVKVTPEDETDGTTVLKSSAPTVASISGTTVNALAAGTTDLSGTIGTVTSAIVKLTVYEALVNIATLTAGTITANSATINWTTSAGA